MKSSQKRGHWGKLSARELEVLTLIGRGKNNDDISKLLFISPHTVKNHISSIYNKMRLNNRTQVALRALKMGLVSIDEESD